MSNASVLVRRQARVPDALRVQRYERAPELGPRLLFLSGGSALRRLSRRLKSFTHNSVHLITPFDSGGSSKTIRDAFDMLSVGDLRNRLVSLADESVRGNPEIYTLLSFRLSQEGQSEELRRELNSLVLGDHPLVAAVPDPLRQLVQTHLGFFQARMGPEFDLRGANIGNLLITGGFLANNRDIQSVLFLFGKLIETRGIVHPTCTDSLHLAAQLSGGGFLYGQHSFSRQNPMPGNERIDDLFLVDSLIEKKKVTAKASEKALKWIRRSDLICYPMGSYFSSVLCHLLPQGVAETIASCNAPKVYIPNTGIDPEQQNLGLGAQLDRLERVAQKDSAEVQLSDLLDIVLIDSRGKNYAFTLDVEEVRARGIRVLDTSLCAEEASAEEASHAAPELDATRVSEALLSLC